jgi:hypothetical protein
VKKTFVFAKNFPPKWSRVKFYPGRNALMLSAFCGHGDVVRAIFEATQAKELLGDVDAHGWTALFYAAAMGHDQVVERNTFFFAFFAPSFCFS